MRVASQYNRFVLLGSALLILSASAAQADDSGSSGSGFEMGVSEPARCFYGVTSLLVVHCDNPGQLAFLQDFYDDCPDGSKVCEYRLHPCPGPMLSYHLVIPVDEECPPRARYDWRPAILR